MNLLAFVLSTAILQSSAAISGDFVSTCTVRALKKFPDTMQVDEALRRAEKRCTCLNINMDPERKDTYIKLHLLSMLSKDDKKGEAEIMQSTGGEKEFSRRLVVMAANSETVGNICDRENQP